MPAFRTIVFVAAVAGSIAGFALTVLQQLSTVPLIRQAEIYEASARIPTETPQHDAVTPNVHGWPADGLERLVYSAVANIVGAIGLGLLLVALSEIGGGLDHWRRGLLWGLGGFVAFTLAPSLSLPPVLPGTPGADLASRQAWWIATVALTTGGLAIIVFRRAIWAASLGIAFIVAPHIVGAPQAASFDNPVPHDLAQRFVTSVLVTNLLFWALLGSLAGFMRSRMSANAAGPA